MLKLVISGIKSRDVAFCQNRCPLGSSSTVARRRLPGQDYVLLPEATQGRSCCGCLLVSIASCSVADRREARDSPRPSRWAGNAALQIETFAPASTFEVRLTLMMLDGSSVEISLLSRLSVRTVVATSRKARRLPPPGCLESIRVLKAFHQRG